MRFPPKKAWAGKVFRSRGQGNAHKPSARTVCSVGARGTSAPIPVFAGYSLFSALSAQRFRTGLGKRQERPRSVVLRGRSLVGVYRDQALAPDMCRAAM